MRFFLLVAALVAPAFAQACDFACQSAVQFQSAQAVAVPQVEYFAVQPQLQIQSYAVVQPQVIQQRAVVKQRVVQQQVVKQRIVQPQVQKVIVEERRPRRLRSRTVTRSVVR